MKKRLFIILFLPGFAGVLSLLLLDLSAFASLIPNADVPPITSAIKILGLIQPAVLVGVSNDRTRALSYCVSGGESCWGVFLNRLPGKQCDGNSDQQRMHDEAERDPQCSTRSAAARG